VAKDGATMKTKTAKVTRAKVEARGERGLPIWPRSKPLPDFKSEDEERAWWSHYDREPPPEDAWAAVSYEPQATRQAREHVYRIRFDDLEMGILQALAKRRGVSAAVILRELVRERARDAKVAR
jgi:hypothetical protein